MIKEFNNVKGNETGIINKSILDVAKHVYDVYPDIAGELAISALEYALTGQISSDDYWIKGIVYQGNYHLKE